MKKLFKSFWKIILILVLIAAVVVLAIIFWPKTTGEKISKQVLEITSGDYVTFTLEKQQEVVTYIETSEFMDKKVIPEGKDVIILENAKNKLVLSQQIVDNINFLNRYSLMLDKKQDKATLKSLKKEIKAINKNLKNIQSELEVKYNLVSSYKASEETLASTAKIKVENFIEVVDKQLVVLDRLQKLLYNNLVEKVSANTLEKAVLINSVEYSSALIEKANTKDVKYSDYSDSLNDYVAMFTQIFGEEFDYNTYYTSKELQDFVLKANKVKLHDFYMQYKTENYERYINVMGDIEKQNMVNYYNSLTALLSQKEEGGNE